MRIAKLTKLAVLLAAVSLPAQGRQSDRIIAAAVQALRAKNPTQTIELLKQVRLNQRQDLRKLLAAAHQMRGLDCFKAKKTRQAYRDYMAANRLTPKQEQILQSLGVITFELGRKHDAENYMKRVLKLNPKNPHALSVLGQIAKGRDNVGAASRYFNQAARQDPGRKDFARMADKLGKQAKVEKNFITLDKGNFRLQFERGKDAGVEKAMQTVHGYLEQAWRELGATLGARPNRRITVVVYNHTQFRRVSSAHSWARAYYDGKVRVALKGWPAGRTELRRDLRHELTHAFLRECYKNIPTWLHEGLAQSLEGRSVAAAAGPFRSGRSKLLPLPELLGEFTDTRDANRARIGYAQSLALVGYLETRGGHRKLQQLLRTFRRTKDSGRAVQMVYGKPLAELMQTAVQ